jgi:pyruvate-ferredoxin/flavodoxin oxidoreductase
MQVVEGPAWANSLFEDNAEYGYGMRLQLMKIVLLYKNLIDRELLETGTTH